MSRKYKKLIIAAVSIVVCVLLAFLMKYLFSYHYDYQSGGDFSYSGGDDDLCSGIAGSDYEDKYALEFDVEVTKGKLYVYFTEDGVLGFNDNEELVVNEDLPDKIIFYKEYTESGHDTVNVEELKGFHYIAFKVDEGSECEVTYRTQSRTKGYHVIGNQLYTRFGIDWFADEYTKKQPYFSSVEEMEKYFEEQYKNKR